MKTKRHKGTTCFRADQNKVGKMVVHNRERIVFGAVVLFSFEFLKHLLLHIFFRPPMLGTQPRSQLRVVEARAVLPRVLVKKTEHVTDLVLGLPKYTMTKPATSMRTSTKLSSTLVPRLTVGFDLSCFSASRPIFDQNVVSPCHSRAMRICSVPLIVVRLNLMPMLATKQPKQIKTQQNRLQTCPIQHAALQCLHFSFVPHIVRSAFGHQKIFELFVLFLWPQLWKLEESSSHIAFRRCSAFEPFKLSDAATPCDKAKHRKSQFPNKVKAKESAFDKPCFASAGCGAPTASRFFSADWSAAIEPAGLQSIRPH